MNKIKKSLSIFMAAALIMAGTLGNVTAKAAVTTSSQVPTINYAGVEHSPLVVGDTETLTVTAAKFTGDVQYRAFIQNVKTGKWSELTSGYTAAVSSKTPFALPATSALTLGKYKVSVWVKTAGKTGVKGNATGNYDSFYVAGLNCVSRDDNNRVYTDGAANVVVSGLTAKFNGVSGVSGIKGPYLYKLFAVNTATGAWSNGAKEYSATPTISFKEAGTYMVVAHVNTEKSTTWNNYVKGIAKGSYEGWKTVKVVVSSSTVIDTTIKAASFGAVANVTLTADGVKNYPKATQYQIFAGTSKLSAPSQVGTATTIFPAKVAGDLVIVKLLDASNNVVETVNVALGQSGSVAVTPVPPVTPVPTSEVKAVVKAASFGAAVTVTSAQAGATQYQVFSGASKLSAMANLGTATTIFPAKVVGDAVTVKLYNAAGTVVGTSDVVLAAN